MYSQELEGKGVTTPFWFSAATAPDLGQAPLYCTKLATTSHLILCLCFPTPSSLLSFDIQTKHEPMFSSFSIMSICSPCYEIVSNFIGLVSFRQEARFQHAEIRRGA